MLNLFKSKFFFVKKIKKDIDNVTDILVEKVFSQLNSMNRSKVVDELKSYPISFIFQEVESFLYRYLRQKKLEGNYRVTEVELRALTRDVLWQFEVKLKKNIDRSDQWNIV
jgi:hypothetical protein